MLSKIVDNVQIYVKNIHIRYEDGSSRPEVRPAEGEGLCSASFRCRFDHRRIQSCLDRRKLVRNFHSGQFERCSQGRSWASVLLCSLTFQLVKLEALSVYFDTDCGSLDKGEGDRAGTIDALRQMVCLLPMRMLTVSWLARLPINIYSVPSLENQE